MAIEFSGTNQGYDWASDGTLDIDYGGAITLSLWVNPDVVSGTKAVFLTADTPAAPANTTLGILFRIGAGDEFGIFAGWSTTAGVWSSTTSPFSAGVWQHVLIQYDGSSTANNPTARLDDVSVTLGEDVTPSGTRASGIDSIRIAEINQGSAADFDGHIAEIALWNSTLSAAEATALAGGDNPTTVDAANLKMYLEMRTGAPSDHVTGATPSTTNGTPTTGTTHPSVTAIAGAAASPRIRAAHPSLLQM